MESYKKIENESCQKNQLVIANQFCSATETVSIVVSDSFWKKLCKYAERVNITNVVVAVLYSFNFIIDAALIIYFQEYKTVVYSGLLIILTVLVNRKTK